MRSDDRFGVTDEAFVRARESHGTNNPILRLGTYVPTRDEVASMPADDLLFVLDCWFGESPSELIPSSEQIREVRGVLTRRGDADTRDVQVLIALCDEYIKPESGA